MSWAEENSIDVGIPSDHWEKQGGYWLNQSWTTAKGETIRICDMTDLHLYHACRKFNDDRLFKEVVLRMFYKEFLK